MEANVVVKLEAVVSTAASNGQPHATANVTSSSNVPRLGASVGSFTSTNPTVFVPRVGQLQIPAMSPRKVGDPPTPVRFVIAQTVGGTVTSTQFSIAGNQSSLVGINQQGVLVGPGVASTFIAASPRKFVPVLSASAVRPQVRPALAVVGGRTGNFTPIVQPMNAASTRSPAKIAIVSTPRTLAGAGQVITLVANNIGPGSAVKASPVPPYKVVIRPSTGLSVQPVVVGPLSTSSNLTQFSGTATSSVPISVRPSLSGIGSNFQQLPVCGSKFQYVRLVAAPSSQPNLPTAVTTVSGKVLSPPTGGTFVAAGNTDATLGNKQKVYSANVQSNISSKRLILPATTSSFVANDSSRTSTEYSDAMSHMMKAAKEFQVTEPSNKPNNRPPSSSVQPIVIKPEPGLEESEKMDTFMKSNVNGSSGEEPSQKPRKPCNCTKSQCLKLYCDCFANGEFCNGCNCCNCANNLDHEEDRLRAIRACLDRNPLAFHPKIGKGREGDTISRQHAKGCNCKRSGCLKNYCECYEAKILCSFMCKCFGCKNYEDSQQHKTLMHLADAAEVRVLQQVAANSKLATPLVGRIGHRSVPSTSGQRPAYSFVTSDVVEATCECLLATMEESSSILNQSDTMTERLVLEEFGRCLLKVIESSNGMTGS